MFCFCNNIEKANYKQNPRTENLRNSCFHLLSLFKQIAPSDCYFPGYQTLMYLIY